MTLKDYTMNDFEGLKVWFEIVISRKNRNEIICPLPPMIFCLAITLCFSK